MTARAPLIISTSAERQYIPETFVNSVILAPVVAIPFFGTAIDQPSGPSKQYIYGMPANTIAIGTVAPAPFVSSFDQLPAQRRQYISDVLLNPLVLASGLTAIPFTPAFIGQPAAARKQFVPDVLVNDIALTAQAVTARVPITATRPWTKRPYLPEILTNPVMPIIAPVGSGAALDQPLPRRAYVPDLLPNPLLPAVAVPVGRPLVEIRLSPRAAYVPDILINSVALAAPPISQDTAPNYLGRYSRPLYKFWFGNWASAEAQGFSFGRWSFSRVVQFGGESRTIFIAPDERA